MLRLEIKDEHNKVLSNIFVDLEQITADSWYEYSFKFPIKHTLTGHLIGDPKVLKTGYVYIKERWYHKIFKKFKDMWEIICKKLP